MTKLMCNYSFPQVPLVVGTSDDAITCAGAQEAGGGVVPIFLVSSVSGQGLDLLKKFLFVLPPKLAHKEREKSEQVRATAKPLFFSSFVFLIFK